MQNKWSVKSNQFLKWGICACADATEGFGLNLKMLLRKALLTGPKFNLNTSSGFAVIKKFVEEGDIHPLYAQRVNRVTDALPLISEFFFQVLFSVLLY